MTQGAAIQTTLVIEMTMGGAMSTDHIRLNKPRWKALQRRSFELPVADSPGANVPDESPSDQPCVQVDFIDYPRLRIRLRDMGLPFGAEYSQSEVSTIIRKSTRTVREWTQKGLMPSHYTPKGRPYYSPQDLEDHFAACERPSRRGK